MSTKNRNPPKSSGAGSRKPENEERMELNLWGGGWGLPSIDPESLQALATIRFSGAPTTIIECNNPWKSKKGSIPFFKQLNSEYLFSAHEIGIYLRSKNFSGDYGLTSIQCAETIAYGQLVWESLHVAYQYYFWIHENNYSDIVRPFYGRRLPWVYKLWYPDVLRRQAKEVLTSIYRDAEDQPQSVELYVLDKAKKCVALLSQKLDKNEFFMGSTSPTTMDAVVFSYLAVFWKVKLPHNPLKDCISANSNLEQYLVRMSQRYFPISQGTRKSIVSTNFIYGDDGELVEKEKEVESFTVTQKVGAGLIASIIMLIYALKNGIVRMPRNPAIENSPEEDEDYWE